jgi:hypothetical protein
MTDDEGGIITPREYYYWKLIYRELFLLPEWPELSAESRAHKLLERIDEKLPEADAPPQRKALFTCPPECVLTHRPPICSVVNSFVVVL